MNSLTAEQVSALARAAEELGEDRIYIEMGGCKVCIFANPLSRTDTALSRQDTALLLAHRTDSFQVPCKN